MSKFIGLIFTERKNADEASRMLKDLHGEGSIVLSAMAVVVKDAAGRLSVKQPVDNGPIGTEAGALIGGLAGLAGGPLGAVLGAAGGALVGRAADLSNRSDRTKFLRKISRGLTPRSMAVIAEITERSGASLDTRIKAIGGTIVRE